MRTWTETHREGTDVGPVNLDDPMVAAVIEHKAATLEDLRECAEHPERFRLSVCGGFTSHEIVKLRSYDGWPYWEPRPAFLVIGPLGTGEWRHIDSYDSRLVRTGGRS